MTKNKMIKFSAFILVFGLVTVSFDAGERLSVGVKEAPPFIIKNENGKFEGIAIDLWTKVASDLNIEYDMREYDLTGLLEAANNKEIDVAVAPLTLTREREEAFDFTHPFYVSGLTIAVRTDEGNALYSLFKAIFSSEFLTVILFLIFILLIIGLIIWIFERKRNSEEFGEGASKGVFASFWWAAVTMTTVGYGDKAPKTVGGRIIGLIWMFAALIIVSSITAALTTALTLDQLHSNITDIRDLHDVDVATVRNSSSEDFLRDKSIKYRSYDNAAEAIEALYRKEVDAVVHDDPIVRHSIKSLEYSDDLSVLPIILKLQFYGFGLKEGSQHREDINREILMVINTVEWKENLNEYLEN
jgi:ABC-type amino acid transport substrate-binding protein